jgi:hypothetical protein
MFFNKMTEFYDETEDTNISTHIACYISENDNTYNIHPGIKQHAKVFGYPLYAIKDFDTKEFYAIGILDNDWKANVSLKMKDAKLSLYIDNDVNGNQMIDSDNNYIFSCLTDKVIESIINDDISNLTFNGYVFKRFLSNIIPDVTKKIEYNFGFNLIKMLNDIVVFKHQSNIMNYKADFLLELKNNFDKNIPSIVVEINEDGHKTYSKENENFRKDVIKSFGNRIITIDVKRNLKESEVEKLIIQTEKQIRQLCRDLIIEYSPEIRDEDFIHVVEEHNIEKSFIKLFLKNNDEAQNNKVFKYTHQEIGDFLGYSNYENYRKFVRETITTNFIENKDFIVETRSAIEGRAKLHGGQNKKTYLLSRRTFNMICIRSAKPRAKQCAEYFATVYDIALDYVQRLRAKNISNEFENKPKVEVIDKRVNDLVDQRVSKYKYAKFELENNELKNKVKEMEKMIEELNKVNEETKKFLVSEQNRNSIFVKEKYEQEYKYEQVKEKLVKVEKNYKSCNEKLLKVEKEMDKVKKENEKLVLENNKVDKVIEKEVVKDDINIIDICSKYVSKTLITHLKNFCSSVGISGYYKYNNGTKKQLEDVVLCSVKDNEKIRNKVIDFLRKNKYIE